ncbi:ribosomal-protein-alanine N-acetyltransferase [Philodulcilactobacillus myokoensis]|uniref:Ribosomal-protein-alanine N-acetyltransferase n=1 Tax=Philodulcilactobacillus myokoensis TaxID=2929573 RepID=A0A9W6B093_9LACO|nr:GNAT family N-acetyltransferase [Philodulcilactobacillus myokoensis]GLB46592.1 ribosomal-protein-alanine N-acetyltransferase [Philodulcilactobacillus myokoensis]
MGVIFFNQLKINDVTLRHLRRSDFKPYYRLISDPDIQKLAGLPNINELNLAKKLFDDALKMESTYAILENNFNSFIGIFSFYEWIDSGMNIPNPNSRELGFALTPETQHHGYMTEILNGVCDFMKHHSKIKSLWCGMFLNNVGCRKLMEKVHFNFKFRFKSDLLDKEELFYQRVLKI